MVWMPGKCFLAKSSLSQPSQLQLQLMCTGAVRQARRAARLKGTSSMMAISLAPRYLQHSAARMPTAGRQTRQPGRCWACRHGLPQGVQHLRNELERGRGAGCHLVPRPRWPPAGRRRLRRWCCCCKDLRRRRTATCLVALADLAHLRGVPGRGQDVGQQDDLHVCHTRRHLEQVDVRCGQHNTSLSACLWTAWQCTSARLRPAESQGRSKAHRGGRGHTLPGRRRSHLSGGCSHGSLKHSPCCSPARWWRQQRRQRHADPRYGRRTACSCPPRGW